MLSAAIKKTKLVRKKYLVGTVLAVFAIIAVSTLFLVRSRNEIAINSQISDNAVIINNVKINVEIANTSQKHINGLCCRNFLAQDSGMFFVYDTPAVRNFWMKDTRIPLDIYWLNDEKKIIYIQEDVQPESYPKSFGPEEKSRYVLETNAGFAKKYSIEVGQTIETNF